MALFARKIKLRGIPPLWGAGSPRAPPGLRLTQNAALAPTAQRLRGLILGVITRGRTSMAHTPHLLLIPGLLCSAALWKAQIRALSDIADVAVGDHTRHDSMREIANAILATAPPTFALAGLSMGGYVACEIVRAAPERVTRLALLDTNARADAPERRAERLRLIALAEGGRRRASAAGIAAEACASGAAVGTRLGRHGAANGHRHRSCGLQAPTSSDHGPPRQSIAARHDPLPDPGAGGTRGSIDAAGAGRGNRRRHCRRAA